MMVQRLTKLALIGVLFMSMGSFSMQPNANDEAPWKRQAKRVAAFTLGALAMGTNTYLSLKKGGLSQSEKAGWVGFFALSGGLSASGYCKDEVWRNRKYKGSFAAAVSYAATGAAFACALHKISEGKGFPDIVPLIAAWLVGSGVYYAQ